MEHIDVKVSSDTKLQISSICSIRIRAVEWVIAVFPSYLTKLNLGNKCDMEEKRLISKERGEKFAEENGMKFNETSAKENFNIEHALITVSTN